jgi:hypothetical protein
LPPALYYSVPALPCEQDEPARLPGALQKLSATLPAITVSFARGDGSQPESSPQTRAKTVNDLIIVNVNSTLPGSDLIEVGLLDIQEGRESIAALLVAVGAPRLRLLGVSLPDSLPTNPEHRLYDLLAEDESDSAHSRYNALIRRLVSFERAAACATR